MTAHPLLVAFTVSVAAILAAAWAAQLLPGGDL